MLPRGKELNVSTVCCRRSRSEASSSTERESKARSKRFERPLRLRNGRRRALQADEVRPNRNIVTICWGAQKSLIFRSGFSAPQVGLEPTTLRLTAECSAIELLRNIGIRRRPTLPDRYQSSTIGTEGLNFCVRYGNRWNPFVIATGNGELL